MKFITNAKIIVPDGVLSGLIIAYDEKIKGIMRSGDKPADAETIDATGLYAVPGFIDMHIHGYLNRDASDGNADGIRKMAEGIFKNGVTSFLPTTMTVSYDELEKAFDSVREVIPESQLNTNPMAEIIGVHAEGPFINPNKKGAQAADNIKKPDLSFVYKHQDLIKVITIAPEIEGAIEFIKELSKNTKILISQGHTDATFEQSIEGIKAGVRSTTHLFNAQTPLNHRNPGVVGAALSNDAVFAELIADTFHVHTGVYNSVYKSKKDKLILITDCTRAGGMPDGEYTLGGQPIFVKGIECLLKDGTIAGSVLRLNNAVNNFAKNTNISLFEAVNAASLAPATALGIADRKGSIEAGKDADIILVDDSFNVKTVIKSGESFVF